MTEVGRGRLRGDGVDENPLYPSFGKLTSVVTSVEPGQALYERGTPIPGNGAFKRVENPLFSLPPLRSRRGG